MYVFCTCNFRILFLSVVFSDVHSHFFLLHLVFDDSSNFIIYSTMMGIKGTAYTYIHHMT